MPLGIDQYTPTQHLSCPVGGSRWHADPDLSLPPHRASLAVDAAAIGDTLLIAAATGPDNEAAPRDPNVAADLRLQVRRIDRAGRAVDSCEVARVPGALRYPSTVRLAVTPRGIELAWEVNRAPTGLPQESIAMYTSRDSGASWAPRQQSASAPGVTASPWHDVGDLGTRFLALVPCDTASFAVVGGNGGLYVVPRSNALGWLETRKLAFPRPMRNMSAHVVEGLAASGDVGHGALAWIDSRLRNSNAPFFGMLPDGPSDDLGPGDVQVVPLAQAIGARENSEAVEPRSYRVPERGAAALAIVQVGSTTVLVAIRALYHPANGGWGVADSDRSRLSGVPWFRVAAIP
jgi:hypothetical protein